MAQGMSELMGPERAAWRSGDLLETLLHLHYSFPGVVANILSSPLAQCPDLTLLTLASAVGYDESHTRHHCMCQLAWSCCIVWMSLARA